MGFVTKEKLSKEENHLDGFAAECAWVTKYGNSDLSEAIAIRPTSETIMYPTYKNWIRSHRDLPLLLNQWNSVVRWEFKHPTPFIRAREFLWQEGHTAHETKEQSEEFVRQILDSYAQMYEDLLALSPIKGTKSELEKFAGADYTTTVEVFSPGSGRSIQAGTSHNLGQNFGKMFGISAEDHKGDKIIPYQTSWGLSFRAIGSMIMVHSDDTGLVLPPRAAHTQVIIVPILFKGKEEMVNTKAKELKKVLEASGVRVEIDERTNYTPGRKYHYWEVRGVPLRMELGPRDIANNQVRVVRRHNGASEDIPMANLGGSVSTLLDAIHNDMLANAIKTRDERISKADNWEDFMAAVLKGNMILTPFCYKKEYEEQIKKKSKEASLAASGEDEEEERSATSSAAKTLCAPFYANEKPIPEGTKCFFSGEPATCFMLWGRSY